MGYRDILKRSICRAEIEQPFRPTDRLEGQIIVSDLR